MRAGVRSFQGLVFGFVILAVACGGGGGAGVVQPPPAAPDFAITFSTTSISVPQGSTSSPVSVSITPENGFSASVQASFSGMPAGVTSNPASPFTVAAGQNVSVLFGAAPDASAGQFSVTAQCTSGALTRSQTLSLTIQAISPVNLPRTSYVENDSIAALDNPLDEPRRRHIVFDSTTQRFYVANRAMNRVEVFSAAGPALLATIPVPSASSVDLAPDAKTLWVGTTLEQLLAVDTATLQVQARYPMLGLIPIPGVVFIRPTEALALSSGKLLVRLRQSGASQALLALWDPPSNTFTNLTTLAPSVFQNGAEARGGARCCVASLRRADL
jgi:hypothetical protein